LTFDARDVDLRSAPHIDAMVINCIMAGWDLHKVLVDNSSQADIIFLHAFDRMGISHSFLKPSDNPLYGFGGKGTFPVGKIELPLSFGVSPNARSEKVTFDIVDMVYPYNAIMGRGSINKFEAAIHRLYLCMKIPGPQGAITVYDNQQAARNIERDFVPGQRNVHCLTAKREVPESASPTAKDHEKAQLQSNDGTKTVPLDQATPKQTVIISEDLTSHDEARLLSCLSKNKDIFAWSALDLVGVNRSIIKHNLGFDPSVRPKK
jgi:ribonuclease HI